MESPNIWAKASLPEQLLSSLLSGISSVLQYRQGEQARKIKIAQEQQAKNRELASEIISGVLKRRDFIPPLEAEWIKKELGIPISPELQKEPTEKKDIFPFIKEGLLKGGKIDPFLKMKVTEEGYSPEIISWLFEVEQKERARKEAEREQEREQAIKERQRNYELRQQDYELRRKYYEQRQRDYEQKKQEQIKKEKKATESVISFYQEAIPKFSKYGIFTIQGVMDKLQKIDTPKWKDANWDEVKKYVEKNLPTKPKTLFDIFSKKSKPTSTSKQQPKQQVKTTKPSVKLQPDFEKAWNSK